MAYTSPFIKKLLGRGGSVVTDPDWAPEPSQRKMRGYEKRDWRVRKPGYAAGVPLLTPDEIDPVPFDEIHERIKARDEKSLDDPTYGGTEELLQQLGVKTKFQSSSSYCHAFAVAAIIEEMLALEGAGYQPLSAWALGNWATKYKNEGGWPTDDCAIAARMGIPLEKFWKMSGNRLPIGKKYETTKAIEDARTRVVLGFRDLPVRGLTKKQRVAIEFSLLEDRKPTATGHNSIRHAVNPTQFGLYEDKLVKVTRNSGYQRNSKGYTIYDAMGFAFDDGVVIFDVKRGH